jgi:hypothetical protein
MTRRERWRGWRRSRPFWGGLLLVLAGLELVAIPLSGVLGHGAIKLVIYIGIGGVFGVLIGLLLIAAGIMLWVNPVHRVFYGIAGIALGIVSFPASNLGGFFLGMLAAIVGGAIGFAWAPVEAPPVPAAAGAIADEEPSARSGIIAAAPGDPADGTSGADTFAPDADAFGADAGRPEEEPADAAAAGQPGTEPAGQPGPGAGLSARPAGR